MHIGPLELSQAAPSGSLHVEWKCPECCGKGIGGFQDVGMGREGRWGLERQGGPCHESPLCFCGSATRTYTRGATAHTQTLTRTAQPYGKTGTQMRPMGCVGVVPGGDSVLPPARVSPQGNQARGVQELTPFFLKIT